MWSKSVNPSAYFTVYISGTVMYGARSISDNLNKRNQYLCRLNKGDYPCILLFSL